MKKKDQKKAKAKAASKIKDLTPKDIKAVKGGYISPTLKIKYD